MKKGNKKKSDLYGNRAGFKKNSILTLAGIFDTPSQTSTIPYRPLPYHTIQTTTGRTTLSPTSRLWRVAFQRECVVIFRCYSVFLIE